MELKGTVDKIEKQHVDKLGKDKWVVQVGGKSYDCWSNRIESFSGKELPSGTTITPAPDGTTFNAKLNLPKEGGFDKKPWSGGGKPSADPEMFILAYKKDCMLKCVDIALAVSGRSDKHLDEKEISKMAVECYKIIGTPLFAHKENEPKKEAV